MGLYHNWSTIVPGCLTFTYDSTDPTVSGGTYPYLAGDSLACKAWKLAATVCTTEPTNYYSNTGATGQSSYK